MSLAALLFFIAGHLVVASYIEDPTTLLVFSSGLAMPLIYLLVFGYKDTDHYSLFKAFSLYGMPLLALSIAILFVVNPQLADWVAYEDFIVESVTALAACLASFILIVIAFRRNTRKYLSVFVTTLVIALSFFAIGMEEISWGQRILNIESRGFFLENNWQGETNLHNFHTTIAMAIFYVATFIIFVVLPFYKEEVTKLLSKVRLKSLSVFIPSDYITVIFATSVGFMAFVPNHQYQLFILIFTLAVLASMLLHKKSSSSPSVAIFMSLAAILVSLMITISPNFEEIGLRSYFFYEWREMLVCLALLIYAIDFAFKHHTLEKRILKNIK